MPNPVSTTDIADRWRPLTPAEEGVVAALLDDAWAIVLNRYSTLEARLQDGSLSVGVVTAVLAAMVLRVMRNPDGKRSEAIDDYSWTRDASIAAGYLYLSDDELALLTPAGDTATGAWTIRPGNPGWSGSSCWPGDWSGHFR